MLLFTSSFLSSMHIGVPRLPSWRLPRGFPPFGRLPPRSDLATSSWKAQCRLVLAVHEEEGSPVTGLRQPTSCPACRLFPSPVQVLPVVVLPSCATLVVCRWDQQRTVDSLPPSPESADTARGTGKERSMGRWRPRASASSLATKTSSGLGRRNRICPVTLLAVHAASGHEAECGGSFRERPQRQLPLDGAVSSAPPHDAAPSVTGKREERLPAALAMAATA